MTTTRLRLQDREVECALRQLWRADADGIPFRQLNHPEFIAFGYVERFITLASTGTRARLTESGRELVTTLVLPKGQGT